MNDLVAQVLKAIGFIFSFFIRRGKII